MTIRHVNRSGNSGYHKIGKMLHMRHWSNNLFVEAGVKHFVMHVRIFTVIDGLK